MDAIVTGSAGLIGAEAVRFFVGKGLNVLGIDNDLRSYFFGSDSSTDWSRKQLESDLKDAYQHESVDIRNYGALERIFKNCLL